MSKNKLKKRRLVCEIFDQKSKSILRKIIELGVMKPSVMIVHFKISKNKMQILDIEDILDEVYRVIAQIYQCFRIDLHLDPHIYKFGAHIPDGLS